MAKKYSLEERRAYHYAVTKNNDSKSKKAQRSYGYIQAVERGVPGNIDERSAAYQGGVKAGIKAKAKSHNIKFK